MKRLLASLLCVAVACGGDKDMGDSDTATTEGTAATTEGTAATMATSSTTTGEAPPAACMCPMTDNCGVTLCGHVSVTCEWDCSSPPQVLNSETDLQCALTALRDRTPGRLSWSAGDMIGQYGEETTLWILADGSVAKTGKLLVDLCWTTGPEVLGTLEAPAYFDGCLAEPDPWQRFICLSGAFAERTFECTPEQHGCDL